MSSKAKIRLYVEHPLGGAQRVPLSRDQANYLFAVMRQGVGGRVTLFNGSDGEWQAEIVEAGKRGGVLECQAQSAPQNMPPDLWLIFAPIKKARTDFIVEKAAEMGAARVLPVQTDFTIADRIRQDRLQAHAVEAAEQCGGVYVPPVAELQKLDRLLAGWPENRTLIFCDEALAGDSSPLAALQAVGRCEDIARDGGAAILIGPEGGFSDTERARLRAMPQAIAIALGPRILRADTAAIAALTLFQITRGDW
jgi:16S rRNA (uracil1498-N3)-methyltransferase